MRTLSILFTALCLISFSIGCGDDEDTDDRPRYRSGVTTTTGPNGSTITVSDLDEGDKRQLCASLDAHVEATVSFDAIAYIACLPGAIVFGGSRPGCEAELDRCMSVFPAPITIEAQVQDETICFSDLEGCNASVAALETCVNVNLGIVFDILDNFSCAGADNANDRDAAAAVMDTANVCADINAACNDFAAIQGPD